jgi:hypothetical protein
MKGPTLSHSSMPVGKFPQASGIELFDGLHPVPAPFLQEHYRRGCEKLNTLELFNTRRKNETDSDKAKTT